MFIRRYIIIDIELKTSFSSSLELFLKELQYDILFQKST